MKKLTIRSLSFFVLILYYFTLFMNIDCIENSKLSSTTSLTESNKVGSNMKVNDKAASKSQEKEKTKSNSEVKTKQSEVADYNKLPEYMANYFGQGHELDCFNICKRCVKDSIVSKVYYELKAKLQVDFVSKDVLDGALNSELASIKRTDNVKYNSLVSEKTEFTEDQLNPKNLFRIYYDQCILYNKAFYA